MYKSQLQEYVQKAALPLPAYESAKEGAAHQPRFRAAVTVDGVRFESDSGHTTLKAAEHAAAKIALAELMKSGSGKNGVTPALVHESGLCKNLLQEYAQKSGLVLPVYRTIRSGDDHAPTFTSTVDIGGARYSGDTARSKKDAEVKAARTALLAIHKQAAAYAVAECNVGEQPGAAYLDQSGDAKKRFRQPCDTSEEEARVKRTPTSPSLAVALANLSSLKGKVQSDLCADTRKDEGPLADDTRLSLGGPETLTRNQEAPHEPSSQDSCLTQEIRASNSQQKIFSLPLPPDAVPMSMLSQVPRHAQQPCQLQSVVQLEQMDLQ